MKRRAFIKKAACLAGAAAMGGAGLACARSSKTEQVKSDAVSRVALVTDHGVRQAQGLSTPRVASALDRALKSAFDTAKAAEGLRSLVDDESIVGLKLNCLAGAPLSPTTELVDSLVAQLGMAGVTPDRIVLFERGERDLKKGGFTPRRSGALMAVGNDTPGMGYEQEVTTSGMVGSCLSRVLTRRISVMINVGVLKDHNLAGVSAGMKNLFGLIHNPNRYHDDCCDPFVADVLAMPQVGHKLKLTVIDGLTAQCEGGPGYMPRFAWPFDGVLVATDPVALDRVAWELLEARRKEKGLPTLSEAKRPPKWIHTAAKRGLGLDDLARIKLIREG